MYHKIISILEYWTNNMLPESTIMIGGPSAYFSIHISQWNISPYAYFCFSVKTVLHISFRDSDVANLTLPFSAQDVICHILLYNMRVSSVLSSWESCQPVVLSLTYTHIFFIISFVVVFFC